MKITRVLFTAIIVCSIIFNGFLIFAYFFSEYEILKNYKEIPYTYPYICILYALPAILITGLILIIIRTRNHLIIWISHIIFIIGVYYFFALALNSILIVIENDSLETYDTIFIEGRNDEFYTFREVEPGTSVDQVCRCRLVETSPNNTGIQLRLIRRGIEKVVTVVGPYNPIYDDQVVLKIVSDSVSYLSFKNGKSWKRIERHESTRTTEELSGIENDARKKNDPKK